MGMTRRAPRRRKYSQCAIDPAKVAESLDEIMAIGAGEMPVEVMGWYLEGSVRRIRADYPNGWRLALSITQAGNITRVCASLHVSSRPA
jgi:hypothetical protein